MENTDIVMYDIPSKVKGESWSPNTWKTRLSLNLKGLPFRTEWVEFPDIEALCLKIGAGPSGLRPDGNPYYTCPIIVDNTSGNTVVVSNSSAIAEYLDNTYPSTPILFPPGTRALCFAFQDAFFTLMTGLWPIAALATYNKQDARGQEYYRKTREAWSGNKLEHHATPGPERDELWKLTREGFSTIDGWLKKNGEGKMFMMGDTVTYSDVTLAACLVWIRTVFGPESSEWKEVVTWDDGRWDALMKAFERCGVPRA